MEKHESEPTKVPQKHKNLKPIPVTGGAPRQLIANLAAALKMFRPVIVNDKLPFDAPGNWNGDYIGKEGHPTLAQLVNTAYGAMGELEGFIRTHEALKNILSATQQYCGEMEIILLGPPLGKDQQTLRPAETMEKLKTVSTEHEKMLAVIKHAAHSSPEKALAAVKAYYFKNGLETPILDQANGTTELPEA